MLKAICKIADPRYKGMLTLFLLAKRANINQ